MTEMDKMERKEEKKLHNDRESITIYHCSLRSIHARNGRVKRTLRNDPITLILTCTLQVTNLLCS